MFRFHNMTCVGFLVLLSSCMLFSCEGGIISPAEGTEFVFLPGSTGNLTWTFDNDVSTLVLRAWSFTRSGGSTQELLAIIFRDDIPQVEQSSLSGVEIVKPATLLLKKINQSYDGVYKFQLVGSGPAVSNDVRVIIAKKPTATLNCSSNVKLDEGDDFTCVCRGEGGNPPANVTWIKNGLKLDETKTLNNTLTISNVKRTANGTYKCEARSHTDDSFRDEKSVKLIVNFKPIIKTFTSDPAQPINGFPVNLTCESDGVPEPDYMIKFENGSVASVNKTYCILLMGSNYDGIYTCIVKNIKGNDSATLNLTGQGTMTKPPGEGEEFVFLPGSTGKLTWPFDDDEVSAWVLRSWFFTRSGGSTPERLARIKKNGDAEVRQRTLSGVEIIKPATLLLKNVDQSYDGVYWFQLFGSGPTVSIGVRVYIAKKPTATINCSSSITLNEGDDVTCICSEEGGNPPANVTWFKNGKKLGKTEKSNRFLTLSNVKRTAAGTYKCKTRSHTNDSFKDEELFKLIVNFKPIIKSFTSDPVAPINGYPVALTCESDGVPEPDYMIKFENSTEVSTKSFYITVMGSSYDGNYTCIAKNTKGNDSATINVTSQVPASSSDTSAHKWYIVLLILVSGIIIGIILSYIFLCFRRRWLKGRNTGRDPEPKTTEVDSTYQELDLTTMNKEDNYQSLRVNSTSNKAGYDDDSTYTELNKAGQNDENSYQSLT